MKKELIFILKAILATLLYIIGIEIIGSWFFIAEAIKFENYDKYYILIQGALQLIGVLIFIYYIKNKTLKNLVQNTDLKWYLFAIILGISLVFIQTPLNFFYNIFFENEYHIAYKFDGLPKFKNINLISSILLVPIGEELFFREYIQFNLQNKLNNFVAILLAAVFFAAIHSPYMNLFFESLKQDWHLFYITIFGGTISGILYYKSKTIGPSIIFHILWNIMVIIV